MIFVGLTALISILAIFFHFLIQGIRQIFKVSNKNNSSFIMKHASVFSILVLLLMPLAVIEIYKPIVDNMLNEDNNVVLVKDAFYVCKPIEIPTNDKYVVLRLDDVQAYGWTDISIRMMYDAINQNETVVAGVIPKDISTDKRIVKFFKKNDCNIEIAIHGYDHGIGEYDSEIEGEFALLSEDEARKRLDFSLNEISKISEQKPFTFIPPNNQLSEGARIAVQDKILPIISGEGKSYYDYDASTWNFVTESFIGSDEVITKCENTFSNGKNVCIIMLHPQDFSNKDLSVDEERYKEYTKILEYIKSNSIPAITLKEITQRNHSI